MNHKAPTHLFIVLFLLVGYQLVAEGLFVKVLVIVSVLAVLIGFGDRLPRRRPD